MKYVPFPLRLLIKVGFREVHLGWKWKTSALSLAGISFCALMDAAFFNFVTREKGDFDRKDFTF